MLTAPCSGMCSSECQGSCGLRALQWAFHTLPCRAAIAGRWRSRFWQLAVRVCCRHHCRHRLSQA
eukprot:3973634-Alexandrium_andersonii.AAC.1